eukprot:TRINITY_DN70132_c0_g1_i1.p1 TRINITY_DN70132_c0_g1~~TRINITY_DN70132_c0_g1_i1.p1  ORF type:complete len:337 (+),score=13.62 TRINITY_DN70132_c0_g1_i1:101-1111(+)
MAASDPAGRRMSWGSPLSNSLPVYTLCADGFRAYGRERNAILQQSKKLQLMGFRAGPAPPVVAAAVPRPPEARNCKPRPVQTPLLAGSMSTSAHSIWDVHPRGGGTADSVTAGPADWWRGFAPDCFAPPSAVTPGPKSPYEGAQEGRVLLANLQTTPTWESPRAFFVQRLQSAVADEAVPRVPGPVGSGRPPVLPPAHEQKPNSSRPLVALSPSQPPAGSSRGRSAATSQLPPVPPKGLSGLCAATLDSTYTHGPDTVVSCSRDSSPREQGAPSRFLSFVDFDIGSTPSQRTPGTFPQTTTSASWAGATPVPSGKTNASTDGSAIIRPPFSRSPDA